MRPMMPENKKPGERNDEQQGKKPYATPQIVVHGTVDKITGGLGTKSADIPLGSMIA